MQLRLREIYLDGHSKLTIKEIPVGWTKILKPFGYKKIYLNGKFR